MMLNKVAVFSFSHLEFSETHSFSLFLILHFSLPRWVKLHLYNKTLKIPTKNQVPKCGKTFSSWFLQ